MDWKKYEKEIYETFKNAYPKATINFNQKIKGRYSKTDRQIDVLIEGRIAGKKILLVIDGKYYSENIDVKDVDSFISMVEDINATQGILITSKGYSEGAINRAYYGPTDIELDVLNFEELKVFQGCIGITYSGKYGAILPAPFGWIVDGTRRDGIVATLYQRGKTFGEAAASGEFIYVIISKLDNKIKSLDDIVKLQENDTRLHNSESSFEYEETIDREDKYRTRLRKITRKDTQLEEYTGFVEFDNFCVCCVLFTPEQLKEKNVRKLEYVIERLVPIDIDIDNIANERITELKELIGNTDSNQEKAEYLIQIAKIYREIEDTNSAISAYKESVLILPINYGARLGLLEIGYNTDNRDSLVEDFFNLQPGNRQICDDIVRVGIENEEIHFTEHLLLGKVNGLKNDLEALGNIYFSLADLFCTIGKKSKALKYIRLAKKHFIKCFSEEHPAVLSTNELIIELGEENKK